MTQSIRTRTAPTALLAAALVGCTTVGPDYRPPETQLSEAWASPVSSEAVDGMWWRRFDDPLLAELVEAAIAGNKDIEEAGARLREARANRDAVYGRELPQAGVSAIATQNRLSENGQLPVGKVPGSAATSRSTTSASMLRGRSTCGAARSARSRAAKRAPRRPRRRGAG